MTVHQVEWKFKTQAISLPPRPPEPERSPSRWKFVVGCFILPPLLAFLGASLVGPSPGYPVAAAATARPTAAPASLVEPVKAPAIPGDLLHDLGSALDEGMSSPIVHLETSEEEKIFENIRDAAIPGEGGRGLTLFRRGKRKDGVDVFEVTNDLEVSQGVIHLEKIEGRWHVVGVGAPGSGLSSEKEKETEKSSRDEAVAALNALLDDPDKDIRRAAAAALEKLSSR